MESSKERFLRQLAEHENWLAGLAGLVAFHPRTEPECQLVVVCRGMSDSVRQAIRARFDTAKVLFQEGEVKLHTQSG